jgi:predicted nucleic acid-binding protein
VDNLPAWAEVRSPTWGSKLGIGAGEDEAISLALELGNVPLLIDDSKARAFAKSRGILTIGTVAILDLADETGLLDFFAAISMLRATNFRMEQALLEPVLAKVRARKNV